MQAGTIESVIGQPIVERRQPKCQRRPPRQLDVRKLRAKRD